MRQRVFRPALVAICSCLLGLIVGVAVEYKSEIDFKREMAEMVRDSESRGYSPPQVTKPGPAIIPTICATLFGVLGTGLYLGYYVVSRKSG